MQEKVVEEVPSEPGESPTFGFTDLWQENPEQTNVVDVQPQQEATADINYVIPTTGDSGIDGVTDRLTDLKTSLTGLKEGLETLRTRLTALRAEVSFLTGQQPAQQ